MEFENLIELKQRVMPALRKRVSDLNFNGCEITVEDIWEDLKINKWMTSHNLTLNEIVNDILKYNPKQK